ncbi:hypothetical protein PTKIN_Ptkin17bG0163900 [Pterospermum kingtungense]
MPYTETPRNNDIIFILLVAMCLSAAIDYTDADKVCCWRAISQPAVRNLPLRWAFYGGKDISATPAVANGVVYFPSWNGYLYAVNAFNGALIWQQNLSQHIYGPAVVIAVSRTNGRLVWSTTLDPRPRVVITESGTAYIGPQLFRRILAPTLTRLGVNDINLLDTHSFINEITQGIGLRSGNLTKSNDRAIKVYLLAELEGVGASFIGFDNEEDSINTVSSESEEDA